MFLFFLVLLATETTESSNMIKYAHLESYIKLFDRHPIYFVADADGENLSRCPDKGTQGYAGKYPEGLSVF